MPILQAFCLKYKRIQRQKYFPPAPEKNYNSAKMTILKSTNLLPSKTVILLPLTLKSKFEQII